MAVVADRRHRHAHADPERRVLTRNSAAALVPVDLHEVGRQTAATELDRVVERGQPGVEQRRPPRLGTVDRAGDAVEHSWQHVVEEGSHLRAERVDRRRVHRCPGAM